MGIFEWLRSFFGRSEQQYFTGVVLDDRMPEEKESDVTIAETVAKAIAVEWREIEKDKVRQFGVQNQKGKSSCVAETRRKLKRILFKVNKGIDLDFSSVAFYRNRRNYPRPGMVAYDAISMDAERGMTLDVLVPSDAVETESAANALVADAYNDEVAKVFRTQQTDVIFTPGDLDTPAGTIQRTRKGVMMWFYATYEEWSREIPVILDKFLDSPEHPRAVVVHSVPGIEPALYQGKEGVWIEDSAHFGGHNRRFITREFYQKRNFFASYPMAFKFEPPVQQKPSYDGSVSSLQDCLKHEGLFPTNIDSTSYFGALTRQAVKDFQKKYGLEQVGTVGPFTTKKLKELYP